VRRHSQGEDWLSDIREPAAQTNRKSWIVNRESMANPASRPILVYDRIGANKRETWLLMILFVAVIGALAAVFTYALGAPVGVLGIIGIALIVYDLSYSADAGRPISAPTRSRKGEWEFVRRVENLSIGAGLPMPKTWVLEDSAPNAFATGRDPRHSHVVVTRGLLDKLEPAELEGVLAHELSHIGNYDIRVMTVVTVLVGLTALLSDVFLRFTIWGAGSRRGSRDKGGTGSLILVLLAILGAIIAPIVAQLIKLAVSRKREYLADASGALLSRNPDALARLLEKIAATRAPEAANRRPPTCTFRTH
jgi:heat shock protein HtpX